MYPSVRVPLPTGQLLGLVLQREQPELEEKKSSLLREEEAYKVQLAAAERSLLQTLATSTGAYDHTHIRMRPHTSGYAISLPVLVF